MTTVSTQPVLRARDLRKSFRRNTGEIIHALDGISMEARPGTLTALVGPDGSGKTTLIRLAAGLIGADGGELKVLGIDVADRPQSVQDRIGYMPQRFGLYEDLSVQENLDLYADLHGISAEERRTRYPRLMQMTALGSFTTRLAGRLSGGMKQKLGLACTLVREPEFLLLDEPTVGVDPLSRRELWAIILRLVHDDGLTVLLSTSYLDEAERCGHVVVMHQGHVLAQGHPFEISALASARTFVVEPPAAFKAREFQARLLDSPAVVDAVPEGGRVRLVTADESTAGSMTIEQAHDLFSLQPTGAESEGTSTSLTAVSCKPRFEDGFMVLLQRSAPNATGREKSAKPEEPIGRARQPSTERSADPVVQVRDLVRQFGQFTAVDHINFTVQRGEIFGLLGPNGAGKTTTFRMLCGLLPATSGTLTVAGADLRRARASARQHIGYVAQKFSLYGQLSVGENLEFFASAYGLRGGEKRQRIQRALRQFELAPLAQLPSDHLPGGFKQRLAMAAALLHDPETLFLDEPTSGADPLARRDFWRRITALSEHGVTIVVTTHFMEEAEYCDRIAIMDGGRVLAQGTPAEIRGHGEPQAGRAGDMEDAFVAIVEKARATATNRVAVAGAA